MLTSAYASESSLSNGSEDKEQELEEESEDSLFESFESSELFIDSSPESSDLLEGSVDMSSESEPIFESRADGRDVEGLGNLIFEEAQPALKIGNFPRCSWIHRRIQFIR